MKVVLWVERVPVAVTVTVAGGPKTVLGSAVSVSVEVSPDAIEGGLKAPVTPCGKPDTVSCTV